VTFLIYYSVKLTNFYPDIGSLEMLRSNPHSNNPILVVSVNGVSVNVKLAEHVKHLGVFRHASLTNDNNTQRQVKSLLLRIKQA